MQRTVHLSAIYASLILILIAWGSGNAGPLDSPGATKALACSACHGFGDNSPGNTVPIIAGMASDYFKKTIKDYAEGRRASPEMEPFAKMVIQFGLDDIAGYFAEQKKQPTRIKVDPAAVTRGRAASAPCAVCHGPEGRGDPQKLIPDLRGQPPGYIKIQMVLWQKDKRKSEDATLNYLKNKLLSPLSEKTLGDLAAYYSSVK